MKRRECMESPSMQPPPPRESIPTLLLLQPEYFEQLFSLMHTLSSMKTPTKGGVCTLIFLNKIIVFLCKMLF